MANPSVILETTAEDQIGFPLILGKAVCDLLGRPARPRYVVFESSLSLAGREFRADVHIVSAPLGTSQPYLIRGGNMPTLNQAIQVVALEALVCLRHSEPAMAESRAFRFFPARPESGAETIPTSVREETDHAVINLVAYGASMTRLNNSLLGELLTTRRRLARAHVLLYLARNPLVREQAQSRGLPFPDHLLEPSLDASVTQAMARIEQQLRTLGMIPEVVPVIPHPPEDGDVDTTLRLDHTPATTRDRHAE